MTYLYLLAGENLELAEAELEGFLRSQGISESPDRTGKLAETSSEPSQLKRLALTHEISRKKAETTSEELEDFSPNSKPDSSFAVRVENLTEGEKRKDLEKILGQKFSCEKNSVNLENPETVIKAYITREKIVLGEIVQDINRGLFKKRKNQNRPFSSPISLDPVLARVLVNLSGVKPGEHVLDPFCGTGGILIEAGLCGVGVHGLDVKQEMKNGSEENLESCGIINHDIKKGEISDVRENFERSFNAILTDLPYGKSSKKTEDALDEFLDLIEDFEGKAVFMWNEEELRDCTADFRIYIHKNLTRYIFIA